MDYKGAITHILNRLEKELPEHLLYHGHHHTLDVMEATERIANHEGVDEEDLNVLLVAAAYHDSGFIYGPQEHEIAGCEIVRTTLPDFGFPTEVIERVCTMIMATKVPQSPTGTLSDILCDADLDYLGREDFLPIGENLFSELRHFGIVKDIKIWNRIQLGFLTEHFYHTSYGKKYRQPKKEEHMNEIRTIVNGYDN